MKARLRLRRDTAARRDGRARHLLDGDVDDSPRRAPGTGQSRRRPRRAEVVGVEQPGGLAHGGLRRLHMRRVGGAATVVGERDPSCAAHRGRRRGVVGAHAAELDRRAGARARSPRTGARPDATTSRARPAAPAPRARRTPRCPGAHNRRPACRARTRGRAGARMARPLARDRLPSSSSRSSSSIRRTVSSASAERTTNAVCGAGCVRGRRMKRRREDGVASSQGAPPRSPGSAVDERRDTSRGHVPRTSTRSQFSTVTCSRRQATPLRPPRRQRSARRSASRTGERWTQMTLALRDLLPGGDVHLADDAVAMGDDLVLHLHRLDHADEVACRDRRAVGRPPRRAPCPASGSRRLPSPLPPMPLLRARCRRASSAHGGSGRVDPHLVAPSVDLHARRLLARVPRGPRPSADAATAAPDTARAPAREPRAPRTRRRPWQVSPATKHCVSSSARWKPSSVVGPSITNSSSARSIRRRACSRSTSWTMSLAMSGS